MKNVEIIGAAATLTEDVLKHMGDDAIEVVRSNIARDMGMRIMKEFPEQFEMKEDLVRQSKSCNPEFVVMTVEKYEQLTMTLEKYKQLVNGDNV